MKNITVAVSNDVYRAARVWAAQRGTSISRVVQFILSDLPRLPRAQAHFPPLFRDSALIPPPRKPQSSEPSDPTPPPEQPK